MAYKLSSGTLPEVWDLYFFLNNWWKRTKLIDEGDLLKDRKMCVEYQGGLF